MTIAPHVAAAPRPDVSAEASADAGAADRPTVLMVDDDANLLSGLVRTLRKDFQLLTATGGEAALEILAARSVAIVVADMTMPGMSGLQLLSEVRTRHPDVVSIMLTGLLDQKTASDAINHAGVFRFLSKPCVPAQLKAAIGDALLQYRLQKAQQELLVQTELLDAALGAMHDGICILDGTGRITRANGHAFVLLGVGAGAPERLTAPLAALLADADGGDARCDDRIVEIKSTPLSLGARLVVMHDVTAARDLEERLRRDANTDPLTGLANRRRFMAFAAEETARAKRYGRAMSVLMVDADFFKRVNDQYGHAAGDEVLKRIAAVLAAGVRAQDLVARFGGEEFVALLAETPLSGAAMVGERLREAIAAHPVATDAGPVPITVSIGAAGAEGEEVDVERLLCQADEALYAAKRNGRNRLEQAG
jgi:diguanylate cyclase (GGDEF)-like protein